MALLLFNFRETKPNGFKNHGHRNALAKTMLRLQKTTKWKWQRLSGRNGYIHNINAVEFGKLIYIVFILF